MKNILEKLQSHIFILKNKFFYGFVNIDNKLNYDNDCVQSL